MARFFCAVEHRASGRRMTMGVDAMDQEQAKHRAQAQFDEDHPRKIGEIRLLDISATRLS